MTNGGFHSHGDTKKWLVYFMKNPNLEMDDLGVYPHFRKPPFAATKTQNLSQTLNQSWKDEWNNQGFNYKA